MVRLPSFPSPYFGGLGRRSAFWRLLRRGLLADALHIARLANETRHARYASAFDPDFGEDLVDERRLYTIAKRRIDDLVGGAAPTAAATTAVETVDLEDANALDLFHRLDALTHDSFDAIKQPAPEERSASRIGEDVLGLVEQPLRFRLDRGAHLFGGRRNAGLFRFLFGDQHFDRVPAARYFAFADRSHPLLRVHSLRTSRFGLGQRRGLFERLTLNLDVAFHA